MGNAIAYHSDRVEKALRSIEECNRRLAGLSVAPAGPLERAQLRVQARVMKEYAEQVALIAAEVLSLLAVTEAPQPFAVSSAPPQSS